MSSNRVSKIGANKSLDSNISATIRGLLESGRYPVCSPSPCRIDVRQLLPGRSLGESADPPVAKLVPGLRHECREGHHEPEEKLVARWKADERNMGSCLGLGRASSKDGCEGSVQGAQNRRGSFAVVSHSEHRGEKGWFGRKVKRHGKRIGIKGSLSKPMASMSDWGGGPNHRGGENPIPARP